MNRAIRASRWQFHALALVAIMFWLMLVLPVGVRAGDGEGHEMAPADAESPATAISYQNYNGLAELVAMICDDALERFQGFYGPSTVTVYPFTTIGFYEKDKQSELGVTLYDQMIAIVNNETKDNLGKARGKFQQKLEGVLQEVDGYLRIHIRGINAAGQRTSYVVTVEMSEPIYRALHTYL